MRQIIPGALGLVSLFVWSGDAKAASWKHLTEVPDYTWYAGCFGTGCGNLMGFWDRHGFPNFYNGPTGGGLAPLETFSEGNKGIRSMWASKAGFDGRSPSSPGHIDDYWINYASEFSYSYESTAPDPYVTAGRQEHSPDCIGDFIGLSQRKWTNMVGECDGNIDAYSFVFWDKSGARRLNFSYTNTANGQYVPDIQSGLKAWARYRGYEADVFTQLSSFNPERTISSAGFTYNDVKAEIDSGHPLLCFLQPVNSFSRNLAGMPKGNPPIHGVLVYGYVDDVAELGVNNGVMIRTSWGSGDSTIVEWDNSPWVGTFPVRGVIGFHPKPRITEVKRSGSSIMLSWDGPSAQLYDNFANTTTNVHRYQVERATSLTPPNFAPVGPATTVRTATLTESFTSPAFYRVRLSP